jgi:hypothetical protein
MTTVIEVFVYPEAWPTQIVHRLTMEITDARAETKPCRLARGAARAVNARLADDQILRR